MITKQEIENYLTRLESDNIATQMEAAAELVSTVSVTEKDKQIAEALGFKATAKPFAPKASKAKWDEAKAEAKVFIEAKRKKNQRIILGAVAGIVAIGATIATGGIGPATISGLIGSLKTILGVVNADESDKDYIA